MYDYESEIKADIRIYIEDNYSREEIIEKLRERDVWEQELYDELWTADSVTGNASGSYYCNAWKAAEAIAHNWHLLAEALREFGCEVDILAKGAEWCDVSIRCYLLGGCLREALDELEKEFEEEGDAE